MQRIIAVLIGYCFGLFQTSYIYGKIKGIDIRKSGSGNAGTTNALRTMGAKAGLIVLTGDILKCIAAVVCVWLLFGRKATEIDYLLRVYTGFGCVLGHNYPFYMNFKGGKGVACTAGIILSLGQVPLIAVCLVTFFGNLVITHYVSLSSLLIGAELLAGSILLGKIGRFGTMSAASLIELYVVIGVITAEMYIRHRGNIARLISGTERRTYIFKKKQEENR